MPKVGSQYIFVVAQYPGGPASNLVTLAPLAGLDGLAVNPDEFLSHGLVFWRLTGRESFRVEPGLLIVGSLESATVHPAEHSFRIQSESAREPDPGELIEVISFPGTVISHPRDLLLDTGSPLERPPAPNVMVHGQGSVYGVFRTECQPPIDGEHYFEVTFYAAAPELFSVDYSDFQSFRVEHGHEASVEVSLDTHAPAIGFAVQRSPTICF